jgi:HEAT repeat protein
MSETSILRLVLPKQRSHGTCRESKRNTPSLQPHPPMPQTSSRPLLRHLRSDDPDVRHSALIELDTDVDPVEAEDLLPFLHEEDPPIRRLAIRLLGEIGDLAALPALLDALGDEEEDVSVAARQAIELFRTRDTIEVFIAGARHHQPLARTTSVTALGELRNPMGIPALRNAVEDPAPAVRSAALKALGAFADAALRPVLYHNKDGQSQQAA